MDGTPFNSKNDPSHAQSIITTRTSSMMPATSNSIANGVLRNGSFSSRAPSPPYVHVPAVISLADPSNAITPSYDLVGPGRLSITDINIITGARAQVTTVTRLTDDWRYEDRRKAQPILDYLYLGPMSVVRDIAWLQKQGITMLLVARDASMASMRSLTLDKAVAELGVELAFVDLSTSQELIRNFPSTVVLINQHLLRLNTAAREDPAAKQGKVLVMCDTGNERSAAIVTAYIMAMYGRDMISAIQFVSTQRFCTNFDDAMKQLLISYGDLLKAERMTTLASRQGEGAPCQYHNGLSNPIANKKRGIEDTIGMDEDGDLEMDMARYKDRSTFAPFIQGNTDS